MNNFKNHEFKLHHARILNLYALMHRFSFIINYHFAFKKWIKGNLANIRKTHNPFTQNKLNEHHFSIFLFNKLE